MTSWSVFHNMATSMVSGLSCHMSYRKTKCSSNVLSLSWVAIYAKEHAGTKKQAGNGLALQLVKQLYHLGIIEAHRAPGEKKKVDQVTMVMLKAVVPIPTYSYFSNIIGQEM